MESILVVDYCYGFINDHTAKFGSEGVGLLDLTSCKLLIIFSNRFPTGIILNVRIGRDYSEKICDLKVVKLLALFLPTAKPAGEGALPSGAGG